MTRAQPRGPDAPAPAAAPEAPAPQPAGVDPGAAPGPAPAQPAPPPTGQLERPRLVRDAQPRYPAQAWDEQREADVVVLLTVDIAGKVEEAKLVTPAGHGFDEEALRAARQLLFTPARVGGTPTPVQIRYTFRFRIPEKQTVAREPVASCRDECPVDGRGTVKLTGTVYERGRGKPLSGVEVYVLDEDRVILTDENGQFALEGPPGAYAFVIRPPGFYPFESTERIEESEHIKVKYYVRRHRRSRYSTIVWGSEGRAEVARTSLADDEIRTIPGTLGDPIRVAMLLPGVTTALSGLGYPIVRGSLPGDSLYDVDGIPVPMLYHLLFGTAVIHPRFVDEIIFQPGGYSSEQGRFPGGRIAATTARVNEDPLLVADLSLIHTSLFRSQKIGDNSEVAAAARYGTLGYIIEGLASDVVFRYWDYQARLSHRFGNGGKLTLTVIGVQDTVGEQDPVTEQEAVLNVGFHAADLRYRQAIGKAWFIGGAQGGYEFFEPPLVPGELPADDGFGSGAQMWRLRPYIEGGYVAVDGLELKGGADVLYQDFGLDLGADEFLFNADTGLTLGAWAAAEWQLGPLLVNPSIRVDHYRYADDSGSIDETAVDPRIAAAFDLSNDVALKASGGWYSGPSRISFVEPPIVFGPIPAFEGPGLSRGLSRTIQAQAGIEAQLPWDFELAVTGFYHDQFQPIDFSLLGKPLIADPTPCNGVDDDELFVLPFDIDGRTYGAEVMLRRRLGQAFFGWISYAVSRSERTIPEVGTIPFDFDQTHVLNTVLSWEVGRNWTLGAVFHFNTGRPYTPFVVDDCMPDNPIVGYEGRLGAPNAARLPNYWRVDFRVQKREVFDTWFFDFYIDLFNASFQWETIGYQVNFETGALEEVEFPLFVPMMGIRGEF